MEIPELIDIIYDQILNKFREKIEKTDRCIIMTDVDKEKDSLTEQLNDEQKRLLGRYTNALEMRYDYINFQLNSLCLNIGIKYGMALQEAFNEEE